MKSVCEKALYLQKASLSALLPVRIVNINFLVLTVRSDTVHIYVSVKSLFYLFFCQGFIVWDPPF